MRRGFLGWMYRQAAAMDEDRAVQGEVSVSSAATSVQDEVGVSGMESGGESLWFESELTVYGWLMCACAGILEEILIFQALGLSFSFVPYVVACFIAVLLTVLNGGMMVALDEFLLKVATVQPAAIGRVHQAEL